MYGRVPKTSKDLESAILDDQKRQVGLRGKRRDDLPQHNGALTADHDPMWLPKGGRLCEEACRIAAR
jgi:hypothetical protein